MTAPAEIYEEQNSSIDDFSGEPPTCSICAATLEQDGTCERCKAIEAGFRAPCRGCGRPKGRVYGTDLCVLCQDREERERFSRNMEELAASALRRWEETPHRCVDGCGEKVLDEGARCEDCRRKRADERARGTAADIALQDAPKRFQWARGMRAPELAGRVRDPNAIARVTKAIADDVDRYLLVGPAGTGKTSLAVAAYSALVYKHGGPGAFVDAYTLAMSRQQHELGSEPPLVTAATGASVLVLDDLGAERAIATSPIPEVIHARHASCAITIVTSGFPLDQLEQRYGGGIFRRLVEDAEIVDFFPAKGGAK